MTPHEFLAKWRHVELKERTAAQSHFNDLCILLGVDDPISVDPKGQWFTFEKGASKTGGGEGWADVWRKGCFAWEYKGRAKDLDKAFAQLLQYSIALESPPLLIVCDMDRFRIHTNWTNTVQKTYEFTTEDLADARTRDLLRDAFLEPEKLRPSKTRQALTEDAAKQFAGLAQRLRDRGNEGHAVAHFINRLVFCMFAEDVGLLSNEMFKRMLEHSRTQPHQFSGHATMLFAAMKSGGMVGFEKVDWFNGGLFDDDTALPLEKDDVEDLLGAARLDWSEIDPSILGTLFERGLDPDKRSQLGAHYTDRDKIMQIVRPVIVAPLEAEWADARGKIAALIQAAPRQTADKLLSPNQRKARDKAKANAQEVLRGFLHRLATFRVLDPACGSGNFLYLSLLALKDIEHRANLEAEALGCTREFPAVGPECVLGIELNPYAAELARVSVWIGEIQWMRRNGFDASKNPILRRLDTIENRDAVFDVATGQRAHWPEADTVVGNPPFLGGSKKLGELGTDYVAALKRAWPEVPGGADLVCYWFAGAWDRMVAGKLARAGLVSTNSIRGGANRNVLQRIVEHEGIFEAWSDEGWTVEGAAVRVSLVCFARQPAQTPPRLDGVEVGKINADLTASAYDLTKARKLTENRVTCFEGGQKHGPFEVDGETARKWLLAAGNPNRRPNSDVVKRFVNATDIVRRMSDAWVIDFGADLTQSEASLYEGPFSYVETHVQPVRMASSLIAHRQNWWRHHRTRPELRKALAGKKRFIVTPVVAKHRIFAWLAMAYWPTNLVDAIARDDDTTFGILHSRFHEIWALRMGTSLEDRPRYTPSTTFETFAFPGGLSPDIPAAEYADDPRAVAIAAAAARLNELRENWVNPPDLVRREPEVVPGYPDRIVPVSDSAAAELAKRTLTNLYNARPAWLANAHNALDEAVADAYGWGDDFRAGTLTDDQILGRLFQLNQERSI